MISSIVSDEKNSSLTIPVNGNIQGLSVGDMELFFRFLNIDENTIQRLKHRKMDGKKFAKMKEKDLEDFGLKNPIVCYFKDKSKDKTGPKFML